MIASIKDPLPTACWKHRESTNTSVSRILCDKASFTDEHPFFYVIREREQWAVAPTTTTLNSLRSDFSYLMGLYTSGDYGKFTWPGEKDEEKETTEMETPAPTKTQRLARVLTQFIAIILPIIGLAFLVGMPSAFEATGLDDTLVALILLAWLFLAIDNALNLDIVKNAVGLAKEIKDIT